MLGADYWDSKYRSQPYSSGKGPLEFLQQMLPRLQKGKVLDLGMGEGANAVYLAQKGFHVKGIDLSPEAVEHAQKLAQQTGVEIESKVADLDLFIMGLMEFDSIVMTYFKPAIPRYYSEMIRALKMGGTLLVHSLTTAEQTEALGPEDSYKNFYFHSNELLNHLKGMRILYYNEGEIDGKSVVQCLAQKPLDKDVAKYNLFDMGSAQQSKPKSTQQDLAEALFKKK